MHFSYVCAYQLTCGVQAVPLMEELPEYKAVGDEEGRRAAFLKYVKRQKVG
jgi:hypothetical protein